MVENRLKYSLLRNDSSSNTWSRKEKRKWFVTLFLGCIFLYSTRTSMPLLIPTVSKEKSWSKTESGTILSSFFWGYTLTQIIGGYLSDRYGGEKIIFISAIGWSTITFLMPNIIQVPKSWNYSIPFIVFIRILNGAFQGVHFPACSSITSQNLSSSERASFFSILTSGSAVGTLLTGILGSLALDFFGWQTVFRMIGFLGLFWTLLLRYHTMSSERNRIINISQPLSLKGTSPVEDVPWLYLLSKRQLWACLLAHSCEMNCFFVLLSWLPTFFHENFPLAKGWIVNVTPWLCVPPITILAKLLTDFLLARKWSLTNVRKLIQSICFIGQNCALFVMCQAPSFNVALISMSIIIGVTGFHNTAVTVNPQDLAPSFSGSVFGLMNTVGAIPGFLGVYLAGHILELTQSWSAVFSTAAFINFAGWFIFCIFGSAEPIV